MPSSEPNWIEMIEGDCLDIMPTLEAGSIDLILTDLPYGTTSNKWDAIIPFEPMWREFKRLAKGAIVLHASQPFTSALVMSNPGAFRHEWIWQKNAGSNFANTVREPMKEHESVLVFAYGKWTYNPQMQERAASGKARVKTAVKFETGSDNYRQFERVDTKMMPELRVPSSVQKFNRQRGLHPTQKPVDLLEYLIRTYSNPGDTVLSACFGSGSVGVAARNTGRNCIGIEKEPKYYAVAEARLWPEQQDALKD